MMLASACAASSDTRAAELQCISYGCTTYHRTPHMLRVTAIAVTAVGAAAAAAAAALGARLSHASHEWPGRMRQQAHLPSCSPDLDLLHNSNSAAGGAAGLPVQRAYSDGDDHECGCGGEYSTRARFRYQGERDKQGRAHGLGEMVYSDGSMYRGEWRAGQRSGRGVFTWRGVDDVMLAARAAAEGSASAVAHGSEWRCYVGQWANDLPCGSGAVATQGGTLLCGDWRAGRLHGHGLKSWQNGSVYTGTWADGRAEGVGCFIAADVTHYQGQWHAGRQHGVGLLTYANGDSYKGEFCRGRRHGRGYYQWANGDSFFGDWCHGEPKGWGVYTWASGARFEGEHRGDCFYGKGLFVPSCGDRTYGWWVRDELVAQLDERLYDASGRSARDICSEDGQA